MTIRVLGIAGSLRRGSGNRAALAAAVELQPDGMSLDVIDLRAIYDGDVEAAGLPAPLPARPGTERPIVSH